MLFVRPENNESFSTTETNPKLRNTKWARRCNGLYANGLDDRISLLFIPQTNEKKAGESSYRKLQIPVFFSGDEKSEKIYGREISGTSEYCRRRYLAHGPYNRQKFPHRKQKPTPPKSHRSPRKDVPPESHTLRRPSGKYGSTPVNVQKLEERAISTSKPKIRNAESDDELLKSISTISSTNPERATKTQNDDNGRDGPGRRIRSQWRQVTDRRGNVIRWTALIQSYSPTEIEEKLN